MKIQELYKILKEIPADDRKNGDIELLCGNQYFDIKDIFLFNVSADMTIELKKIKYPYACVDV